jgi:hypothetical protein
VDGALGKKVSKAICHLFDVKHLLPSHFLSLLSKAQKPKQNFGEIVDSLCKTQTQSSKLNGTGIYKYS